MWGRIPCLLRSYAHRSAILSAMRLPNANEAIVDLRKLEDYCLNPEHPRGKHKARVFEEVLGVNRSDASELRAKILEAAVAETCNAGESDVYGDRYILDFNWTRDERQATIRTTWIVKRGEAVPRLTSCYVL